jgi:hypothetical protein
VRKADTTQFQKNEEVEDKNGQEKIESDEVVQEASFAMRNTIYLYFSSKFDYIWTIFPCTCWSMCGELHEMLENGTDKDEGSKDMAKHIMKFRNSMILFEHP